MLRGKKTMLFFNPFFVLAVISRVTNPETQVGEPCLVQITSFDQRSLPVRCCGLFVFYFACDTTEGYKHNAIYKRLHSFNWLRSTAAVCSSTGHD